MKTRQHEASESRSQLSRREMLQSSMAGLAACAAGFPFSTFAFPPEKPDEVMIPFLDMPRTGEHRLDWETLDTWLTPQDQVFDVQHYGIPEFDATQFKLQITGQVERPATFTIDQIKSLPKKDQLMTLECSGNGSSKGFMNAIYNSRWTGTPLAPLLKKARINPRAKEVVFFGMDRKTETLRPGSNRELAIEVPFGRSMSVEDALKLPLLLAYERNGQPLEKRNGAPLRLIVPGWYGIANVKWLTRIDVRDRRYMGRYMARDYVTVRGERRGDEVVYLETSVARMNVKSIVARVTRRPSQNRVVPLKAYGAAWSDGAEIKKVEIQLDGSAWRNTVLDRAPRSKYCWVFFSLDLGSVKPGKHILVSRAVDANGRVQPAEQDDEMALKKTYWEAYQQWPRAVQVDA
jgi:DMSO/TMAO reductase YedYZ molybdopterin-dependent catalytic subunit